MSQDSRVIYFRLDCGGTIGFGHLSRCHSIAKCFEDIGFEISFIIRKRPSLKNFQLDFPIIWLDEAKDVESQDVVAWLVGGEEFEASEVKNLKLPVGIMFVDHYALGALWCRALRQDGFYLVKMRDFGLGSFHCNLVVDYRYSEEVQAKNILSGFSYIPLSPEIKKYKPRERSDLIIGNVGVYIGGAGFEHYEKCLKLLEMSPILSKAKINWIVPDVGFLQNLKKVKTSLGVEFLPSKPSLFEFYQELDLFIGASGVSFFERAYLNIPQLNFTVADNQKSFAEVLVGVGAMCLIGQLKEDSVETLCYRLNLLLERKSDVIKAAEKGRALIGADGSLRICRDVIRARGNFSADS